MLWRAGDAAYQAGDLDRARSMLLQALTDLPSSEPAERRARMMTTCALTLRDLGKLSDSITMLKHALDLLPEHPVTEVRAEVLCALSNVVMRENDLEGCMHYGEIAVAAAREVGATQVEADAAITLGYGLAGSDSAAGIAALQAGLDLALRHDHVYIALRGYINLSDLFEALGRSRESSAAAQAGIELAQRTGMLRTLGTYLTGNLAEALLHLGEWERTRALVGSALEGRPEGIFEATAQVLRAELAALCGDYAESREALLRTAAMVTDPNDDQFTAPLATIDADIHRAVGDYQRARDIVLATLASKTEHLWVRYLWPLVWTGVRADVEQTLTDPGWGGVHPILIEFVERMPAPGPADASYRAMITAEQARLTGDADWVPVVAAWRALDWPWPLAYSLLRDAEQRAAADPLRESWTIATALGARPLLAEAEQLAQRLRLDLGAASDLSRNPLDELNLTAREQEVLLLLAAGRSNPEIAQELFISPKTASVHVSNILAKLGLSSRVQAATLVHRLGLGS